MMMNKSAEQTITIQIIVLPSFLKLIQRVPKFGKTINLKRIWMLAKQSQLSHRVLPNIHIN